MQKPRRSAPRESTEAMVRNIGRELAEIEQAIGHCKGDGVAEPQLTGSSMAHLLISSKELLNNLLIWSRIRRLRVRTKSFCHRNQDLPLQELFNSINHAFFKLIDTPEQPNLQLG